MCGVRCGNDEPVTPRPFLDVPHLLDLALPQVIQALTVRQLPQEKSIKSRSKQHAGPEHHCQHPSHCQTSFGALLKKLNMQMAAQETEQDCVPTFLPLGALCDML